MLTDSPWAGLEQGRTDSRRVSASGKWNFFWTVFTGPDPALAMQVSELPQVGPELPKLRNLDVGIQSTQEGAVLYLRLRDRAQVGLFQTLCLDIIKASDGADDEGDALRRVILRTYRWHHLLEGGKLEALSEEAQKGLIGELQILDMLLGRMKPSDAIGAWTGPLGAPKDFELSENCIEVKARRGGSQPFVSISNEHQLADVVGSDVWLAVLSVDRAEAHKGLTLEERVDALRAKVVAEQPSALFDLERKLDAVGYDATHDYSRWPWSTGPMRYHSVTSSFPRIASPVVGGVSRVKYSLSLEACESFVVDTETVLKRIFEEPRIG